MVHSSLVRQTSDYKSSSNNCRYSQRGRKPFLSLRSHSEASTKQSSPHLHGTEKQDINFQVHTPPKPMLMLVINCITLTTGINSRVTLRSCVISFPEQSTPPKLPPFGEREKVLIDMEVIKLLSKGAIRRVTPCSKEFI